MHAAPMSASAVAEMEDICGDIMARWNARQAARAVPFAPKAKPTREQLQAELAAAREGFDPQFAFSDDYTFFCAQQAKSERINALSHELEWGAA